MASLLQFTAIAALFSLAVAAPISLRGLEPMVSDCIQQCTADFHSATNNLEFAKTTDYGSQLINLNKTCKASEDGQACIKKCNIETNPLDIPALTVMCDERRRAEVASHQVCYEENNEHVNMICDEKCGAHLMSHVDSNGKPMKPTLQETATACTRSRCHASCSRDAFGELCKNTDPAAGLYLQQFFIEVLDAFNQGLEEQGLMPFVWEKMPKECHAMFSPLEFFGLGSPVESVPAVELTETGHQ
uniref:Uncharacterized protein n=1 Tax=Plectus sambesii TaxID=2011161 RepID=A0A914W4X6_9BILA